MRTVAAFGLVVLLGAAAAPADPVPIKWKLAKGDQFFVRSVQEMEQTVGVLGMNKESKTTTTTATRFKVLEAGTDGYTVEQTIMKVEIAGEGADAAKTDKMKGATLTFTLDKDFKVTKVDGFDKYIEQLAGGNDMEAAVAKASASEDTVKVTVEDLFNPGPGKPAAKGDKWTRETKLPLGPLGTFQINARYTLNGVEGGVADIGYEADASFTAGKGGAGLPFEITKGELKADKYDGTLTFDTAAGRLKGSTQAVKLGGTLTVSAMGNEIELTFKQDLKVTSTVSEKDPGD